MTTPCTSTPASADALNRQFGIPGSLEVVAGNGGLAKVVIATAVCRAEMYLHGAQVTAWKPAGAEEAIFLSEQSHWQEGRAIRGGIPICFPWFRAKADDAKAPAHGFVRTKAWRLDSVTVENEGSVTVACSTESDESTRQWFPHEFRLVHRVSFGAALELELTATNTGQDPFGFQEALHTYFRVGDVEAVRVHGLDGVSYVDNVEGNREKIQHGDVSLKAATDNAYLQARGMVDLIDAANHRTLRTEKENSATTVVWNPWQQGAAALADLGDDEWRQMTCVEASNILSAAITIGPGEAHRMRARLSIEPA
jgi:glucose-6-phosphate 1-epimerase